MQPRLKFKFAEELGIMPDTGDMKSYENRKAAAVKLLEFAQTKLLFENEEELKKYEKKDDIADALVYALGGVREHCPAALVDLSEKAAELSPKIKPHVQKLVV
jgi:hypothetical protein